MPILYKNGSFLLKIYSIDTEIIVPFCYICRIIMKNVIFPFRRAIFILCLMICMIACTSLRASEVVEGSYVSSSYDIGKLESNGSLLTNLFSSVSHHSASVLEYEARMYVRGEYKVHNRNLLIHFVPSMFKFYDDVSDYLTESAGDVYYMYPDVYNVKMRALQGTFRRNQVELYNALDFLNTNIYSPTLIFDKLISPLNSKSVKYYDYYLDSIVGTSDSLQYCIRIEPKQGSTRLVKGLLKVNHGSWIISDIVLQGRMDLITFNVHVRMGEDGIERLLPRDFNINLMFHFLGNKIESDYTARLSYEEIKCAQSDDQVMSEKADSYDLTNAYLLHCDDSELTNDTALINSYRSFPLTDSQQKVYTEFYTFKHEMEQTLPLPRQKGRIFWGNVGDALVSSYTLNLSDVGHIHFSPLIDLGLLSYSHSNGFSYKQQFNYTHTFKNDRWLRVQPKLGYNFTRKELYWSADFDYYYLPHRLGAFTFNVGNGNRIYTSRVVDELKQNKDSLFNFEKLNLNYFSNTYLQLGNRIELFNGVQLLTSVNMYWREALKPSELLVKDMHQRTTAIYLRPTYVSFAPRVKLLCNPGQYYYMDGQRKVYLYSHFPTFSFDYERGLNGVLGSNGSYERIEADVQQSIRLTPVSRLYYRYGGGIFTNQNTVYFVDFVNFSRANLPVGWNDEISGSFHLLDNGWYNASQWYCRTHLTYESPFIVFPRSSKLMGFVHSERIYFSALYTTHLKPYMEVGYGVGTYLFNLGAFVSNVNGQFHEVGCKFTFELFKGQ